MHGELGPAIRALDPERLAVLGDGEARASLGQLREWLLECEAAGNDLLCFCS
jgi:hypothetical protein